ncbi:MAG: DUF177 domain-containing protein [Lachnospiraceae bacterium]|nr:DUF177 domain-containing protein [Lachnospiraceae bacterium]
MKIDLTKILEKADSTESYAGEYEVESIIFSGMPTPVLVKPFTVFVSNEGGSRLGIKFDITGEATLSCSRCLKEVKQGFGFEVDEVFTIKDEKVIVDPDEDGEWFADNEVDIDQMISDEIQLTLPTGVLCREDCKGLCPVCGCDRNLKECGCDTTVLDPRMAKFLDFKIDL